eukprot:7389242-Prymnesium_polylepis.2
MPSVTRSSWCCAVERPWVSKRVFALWSPLCVCVPRLVQSGMVATWLASALTSESALLEKGERTTLSSAKPTRAIRGPVSERAKAAAKLLTSA